MNRAALPREHHERWTDNVPVDNSTYTPLPNLFDFLFETTSHYDGSARTPPKSPLKERNKLLTHLKNRLRFLPEGNHIDRITLTIAAAILNPIRLNIDVDRLAEYVKNTVEKEEGKPSKKDVALQKYFSLPKLGLIVDPCTIIDCHGRILLWYLPGILIGRMPEVSNATLLLPKLLKKSIKKKTVDGKSIWRVDPKNFVIPEDPVFEAGSVYMAHTWFPSRKQRLVDKPGPSHTLSSRETLKWIRAISDTEANIDLIFSLTSPELHKHGIRSLKKAKAKFLDNLGVQLWPSNFTGTSVIVNRKTLFHRDPSGRMEWNDLLLAAGSYTEATFDLPDIGAKFKYTPGTAVSLCGRVFRHGVSSWEGGERICYAHFMRNNVLHRQGMIKSDWVEEKQYRDWMSPKYLQRLSKVDRLYV